MSTKIIVIISLVLVTITLLSLSILHNHAGLIEEQQDMGERVVKIVNRGERENPLYIFLCQLEERVS